MKKPLGVALILLLPSLSGCLIIPSIPHYGGNYIDSRGRIPLSSREFITEGKTPLAEVLLKLGEPEWIGPDGILIVYRWEMVSYMAILPIGFGAGGTPEFLILRFDDRGACVKSRTVSGDRSLRETMAAEFGHEWVP